jgi:hypothetical protein
VSLTLADNIDKEHITADVNNGVLTINLPKLDEKARAKETRAIEIEYSQIVKGIPLLLKNQGIFFAFYFLVLDEKGRLCFFS